MNRVTSIMLLTAVLSFSLPLQANPQVWPDLEKPPAVKTSPHLRGSHQAELKSYQQNISFEEASSYAQWACQAYRKDFSDTTPLGLELQESTKGWSLKPLIAKTGFDAESIEKLGYLGSPLKWLGFDQSKPCHFGYVGYRQGPTGLEIRITIRGTKSRHDWVTNFSAPMVPVAIEGFSKESQVHTGFKLAADSLQTELEAILSQIRDEVTEETYKNAQVSIIGHSLGGAISSLIGCKLTSRSDLAPQGVHRLITFGAPAVGNEMFVKEVNEKIINVHFQQAADLVTKIKAEPLGYVAWESKVVVPSQLNIHGMGGYMDGLRQKFKKAEPAIYQPLIEAVVPPLYDGFNKTVQYYLNPLAQPKKCLLKAGVKYLVEGKQPFIATVLNHLIEIYC